MKDVVLDYRRVIVSFTLQIKSDNMVLTIIQLMSENVQNSTIENFYFKNLNICKLFEFLHKCQSFNSKKKEVTMIVQLNTKF
jgi:hypothetical protein